MNTRFLNKKKGVAGLDLGANGIMMLFFIGILLFAIALVGAKFIDSTTDTTAIQVINDTTTGIADFVDWVPIIVIMLAVVIVILLLSVIMGAFKGSVSN